MSIAATRAVFNSTAATYDPARARLIPCFQDLYSTAIALLPRATDHVLDLGAGTGLLSAFVRERFDAANLHLIDNSKAMLDQARERFTHDQQVAYTLGDYTTSPWAASYDAIVSALSIHHLTDEAKRALFARIFTSLKPGGIFINAEQILQSTAAEEELARTDWLSDVRALGASDEQIAASLLRQAEDRCSTVDDQLDWLSAAGFHAPKCNFREGRFAVLSATRTPPRLP